MNSIKNVPARVLNRRPGHSLEAEREQFDKTQASAGAGAGWVGGGGAGRSALRGRLRAPRPWAAQVTGSRAAAGLGSGMRTRPRCAGPGEPSLPCRLRGEAPGSLCSRAVSTAAQCPIICWGKVSRMSPDLFARAGAHLKIGCRPLVKHRRLSDGNFPGSFLRSHAPLSQERA